jgi:hypothetical protein
MKFLKGYLLILISFVFFIGCQHNRIVVNPAGKRGITVERKVFFVFYGIGQTQRYTYGELCGNNGVYEVRSYMSFIDGLLTGLTYAILSPRTLEVSCEL